MKREIINGYNMYTKHDVDQLFTDCLEIFGLKQVVGEKKSKKCSAGVI